MLFTPLDMPDAKSCRYPVYSSQKHTFQAFAADNAPHSSPSPFMLSKQKTELKKHEELYSGHTSENKTVFHVISRTHTDLSAVRYI